MSTFERLIKEMEKAVRDFCENLSELNPKNKQGGVLVYASLDGVEREHAMIGQAGDAEKYYGVAKRKIQQLADNPTHLSSFITRDPESGLWGGGVRIPGVGLFAFSGLPELADEACLLKALEKCGLIEEPQLITDVLAISENDVHMRLAA